MKNRLELRKIKANTNDVLTISILWIYSQDFRSHGRCRQEKTKGQKWTEGIGRFFETASRESISARTQLRRRLVPAYGLQHPKLAMFVKDELLEPASCNMDKFLPVRETR